MAELAANLDVIDRVEDVCEEGRDLDSAVLIPLKLEEGVASEELLALLRQLCR